MEYIYGQQWVPDLSTTNPLRHVNVKLLRAIETANNLERTFESFCNSSPLEIKAKLDGNNRAIVYIGAVDGIPDIIPIYISEIFHHIRSSLDHILYLLSEASPDGKKPRSQFPIVTKLEDFKSFRGASSVKPEVKIILESIQPYSDREVPEIKALKHINIINNWDKHNRPAISLGVVDIDIGSPILLSATLPNGIAVAPFCDTLNSGFIKVESGNELASCAIPNGATNIQTVATGGMRYKPVFVEPLSDYLIGENVINITFGAIESIANMVIPKLKPFI